MLIEGIFTKGITRGLFAFLVVCLLLVSLLITADSNAEKVNQPLLHHEWIQPDMNGSNAGIDRVEVLKSGDTAGVILSRLGFPMSEVINIIEASKKVYSLKNVHIGHPFKRKDIGGEVRLSYVINASKKLSIVSQPGESWQAEVKPRELTSRTIVVEGDIAGSLFLDAARAGLEDALTMQLVDIFAWDIDFARDLRQGDTFKVMFEEAFDDEGKRVSYTILAAEFVNKGHVYTGVRYADKKGNVEYYSAEGRNLRKTYLKSPVKYSRISSRFRSSRKHPVLGYTRAHRGVDYAAKSGTPVRAVGDGRVTYKGWKGGYGRFVVIRHNNGIHSTAYAHLRKYGKNIRKGRYVKQGQIIGYVGMSGLATGPHLHFEFRSRGRAINPLKIKYKSAKPIAKEEMSSFRVKAKEVLRKMMLQQQLSEMWS